MIVSIPISYAQNPKGSISIAVGETHGSGSYRKFGNPNGVEPFLRGPYSTPFRVVPHFSPVTPDFIRGYSYSAPLGLVAIVRSGGADAHRTI